MKKMVCMAYVLYSKFRTDSSGDRVCRYHYPVTISLTSDCDTSNYLAFSRMRRTIGDKSCRGQCSGVSTLPLEVVGPGH